MNEFKELLDKNKEIGLTENPDFDKCRKYYDWKNYIPDMLKKHWESLSYQARICAYLVAKNQADKENWQ